MKLCLIRALGVALLATVLARPAAWSAPLPDSHSQSPSLPKVFDKAVPETVQDLKEIQDHVKGLLPKLVPATVGLRIGGSSGSGVILKDGYILTAGHVSGKPDQDVQIILHDGKKIKGKTLGANRGIDSGMIKITDEGEFPYAEMGDITDLKKGAWCLAIGHPNGFQTGRSPVVRLGRVLETNKSFLRSDCTLVGGDSGGPLFDMTGKVIGVHSRIGSPITANIHVPVDTYRESWDRLAKGEVWGDGLFGPKTRNSDAYLGVRRDPDTKEYRILQVAEDSPAEKAGLRVGDVLLAMDGTKVLSTEDLTRFLGRKQPGAQVALQVQRGEQVLDLKVILTKRQD
jgi:serine protease Do